LIRIETLTLTLEKGEEEQGVFYLATAGRRMDAEREVNPSREKLRRERKETRGVQPDLVRRPLPSPAMATHRCCLVLVRA
jgi:hypothetical protein